MFDFSMLCRVNHPLLASPNKNFAAIIFFFLHRPHGINLGCNQTWLETPGTTKEGEWKISWKLNKQIQLYMGMFQWRIDNSAMLNQQQGYLRQIQEIQSQFDRRGQAIVQVLGFTLETVNIAKTMCV